MSRRRPAAQATRRPARYHAAAAPAIPRAPRRPAGRQVQWRHRQGVACCASCRWPGASARRVRLPLTPTSR